jgi:putative ABC transport system ATP-binding protein
MLEVKEVHKVYTGKQGRAVQAVSEVSFSLQAGDFVTVQGPSGCGKSTLLLICGGLLSPDQGRIVLGETDLYAESAEKLATIRSQRIGFVFQQFHLIPYLTLRDNVQAASLACGGSTPGIRVDMLLEKFDLHTRASHVPSELSTGERQRTALARALLNEPQIILADEPTGNLDPVNSTIVLDTLGEFAQDGGAVLMVTHEQANTEYATRCLHMEKGRLVN